MELQSLKHGGGGHSHHLKLNIVTVENWITTNARESYIYMAYKDSIKELYIRRARYYDLTANLYYLAGFREWAYRKKAVKALDLQAGATVVELGCGTGLNFFILQEYIGDQGQIIGVDLTPAMLDVARRRCQHNGWKNVRLVEHDAASYEFPARVDGIISTFALTLIPQYKQVIERAHLALGTGSKLVIGDLRIPAWPRPLVSLAILLTSPFGVNREIGRRHPWEAMQSVFGNLHVDRYYFGAVYIATSTKAQDQTTV